MINQEVHMVDLSRYTESYSFSFNLKRYTWIIVNATIFRWMCIGKLGRLSRILILRLWGAQIPYNAQVYPTCKIWAPWNLIVGSYACIGPSTRLYNKAPITIGCHSVVSQGCYLCTASHDICDAYNRLITSPIVLEDQVWVAADAFVGMGVTIEQGAVVGARSCVFKNVPSWSVVGGNPAKFIKERKIRETHNDIEIATDKIVDR